MATNPLHQLAAQGQSAWLDYIRRDLIESGGLAKLIADGELRGITSNPSIFEKAIAGSREYDRLLEAAQPVESPVARQALAGLEAAR